MTHYIITYLRAGVHRVAKRHLSATLEEAQADAATIAASEQPVIHPITVPSTL